MHEVQIVDLAQLKLLNRDVIDAGTTVVAFSLSPTPRPGSSDCTPCRSVNGLSSLPVRVLDDASVRLLHGLLGTGVGSFTEGTVQHPSPYSPLGSVSSPPQSTGPSPSHRPFGDVSVATLGCAPRVSAVPSFLSTLPCSDSWHRIGWNFACAYIHTYRLVAPGRGFVFPVGPPFRLRVSHYSRPYLPLGRYQVSLGHLRSSPPCRPHTPWYDGEEPKRLRPHSAGSTIPRLWPTGSSPGSLPLITTRWFSASPSDPASRRAPCPPEGRRWWLQVSLGCVPLSPSCPCSLSIPSSLLASEALPPPLDISPGPRAEWDFNPPDTSCCQAHTMSPADFLPGQQRFRLGLIRCRSQGPPGTRQDLPAYDVKHSQRATPNTPAPGEWFACPVILTPSQPSRADETVGKCGFV